MKHLFIIALVTLCCATKAQVNLVPNGGFELYSTCPTVNDNITESTGWLRFRSTPDYYNACAPSGGMSVPNNNYGYQQSNNGNGIVGIYTYDKTSLNYREIIGSQLVQPLNIGVKYYVKAHINKSPNAQNGVLSINTNKIGVNFTNLQYSVSNPAPVTNSAIIYADTIITDAMGWYKLQGSFVATQNYQYIMIGNFFDDSHTDTSGATNFGLGSYYFIDDVCVSTDSLYCSGFVNLHLENNTEISVLNENDGIKIIVDKFLIGSHVNVYNSMSAMVVNTTIISNLKTTISTKEFKQGLYLVEIVKGKTKSSKKIFVHNLN